MSHVVIFELAGQLLNHVVPEAVASATYEITDISKAQGDADRVLASGAATVPAYTLTLDDPAGASLADASLVPVTATAGPVIGDSFVIIAADGRFEQLELEAVATNDYLRARSLIAGEYAAGDTVRGVTITAPVPASLSGVGGTPDDAAAAEATLDDQRPLRVLWSYTTGAGQRLVTETIELARADRAAFSSGPAIKTILTGYPDLAQRLTEGLTMAGLASFSEQVLIGELSSRFMDHNKVMMGDAGRMLLVAKMLEEAAVHGYAPGQRGLDAFAAERHEDYTRQLAAITTGRGGSQITSLDTDHVAAQRADASNRNSLNIGL